MKEKLEVKCPLCSEKFNLDEKDEEGDIVICPECEAELEIITLLPPKIEKVKHVDYADDFDDTETEGEFNYADDYMGKDGFDDEEDYI
ncbi:hypothetical protein ACFLUV_04920 [Elusimicrobiota bacterium]